MGAVDDATRVMQVRADVDAAIVSAVLASPGTYLYDEAVFQVVRRLAAMECRDVDDVLDDRIQWLQRTGKLKFCRRGMAGEGAKEGWYPGEALSLQGLRREPTAQGVQDVAVTR